jgi:endogenous inhibitor of DNA gyrase (YacG/DUF329 family)
MRGVKNRLTCGVPVSRKSRTGLCVGCAAKAKGDRMRTPKAPCARCGQPVPKNDRKYCSMECFLADGPWLTAAQHPAWKGANVTDSGARKRTARAIEAGVCRVCGSPNADRHHINRDFHDNSPENIEFLCRSHHISQHAADEPETWGRSKRAA